MLFELWHYNAMEEHGYTDTNEGLINRLTNFLANNPNDTIDTQEFRRACIACNVDPDSITPNDLDRLRQNLNRIS